MFVCFITCMQLVERFFFSEDCITIKKDSYAEKYVILSNAIEVAKEKKINDEG